MSQSQPWDLPPVLSSSEPWGRTPVLPAGPPTTDFWAQNSPHHKLPNNGAKPWGNLVETFNTPALDGSSTFDPLAKPPVSTETKEGLECTQALPSGKPSSPVELDLFGDHTPSVKQNGTKEPDAFDLDVLGEALAQSSRDTPARRTPESFLGPSASSLVNLDSLVKVPQAVKTRNPFLTGLSTPSPTNPFGGGDQSRRTLNQMRTGSPALSLTAGGPIRAPFGSMTYSASLPLPLSSVPAGVTLPASVSVFPQARAFTPPPSGSLPQPLLPTSGSAGPLNQTPLTDTNPFL